MSYPFEPVRTLMNEAGLVTIMFVYSDDASTFHSRNAFASSGVVEDPATGVVQCEDLNQILFRDLMG